MIKFVNFRASDIEPNPNEVLYWVDLNEDPTGGSIKYWNEKGYWQTIRVLEGTLHEFEERITNWVTEELQEQTEWVEDQVHQFDGRIAIVEGDIQNLYTVKQDKLIPGYGIEITEDNTINCTVDLSLYRVVAELPTEDIDESKIYIVFDPDGTGTNTHEEYVYVDGKWELLGKYADYASITELQQEIADRKAADQQLQQNIDAEIKRATNKETALQSAITKEISDRQTEIDRVEQLIIDESQIREESIAYVGQVISEEVARAIAAEEKLAQDLNAEIERSTTIDGTHTNKISALETKATELGEEIDTEISRATAKETELNEAITNEISRATQKESEIETSLNQFKSTKGQSSGLASLDENGRVPSSQLPESVYSVVGIEVEVATKSELDTVEDISEGDRIYVLEDKKIYTKTTDGWNEGNTPIEDVVYNFRRADSQGRTNITKRWDGSQMTVISETVSLGETTGTAYEGSKGKANRDALNSFPKYILGGANNLISPSATDTTVKLNYKYMTKNGLNYEDETVSKGGTIPGATTTTAGVMTAADKAKLDGISSGANAYTHPAGSAPSKPVGLYKISTDANSHIASTTAVTKTDITALGIPGSDTNTTYTFANGTDGSFTVTPSGGSAQKVTIGKPATAGTADIANSMPSSFSINPWFTIPGNTIDVDNKEQWVKLAKLEGGSNYVALQLLFKSDYNYPSIGQGLLTMSTYTANGDISYSVALQSTKISYQAADEGTIRVVLTKDGYLWIQTTCMWGQSVKCRILYRIGTFLSIYTSDQQVSNTKPENCSEEVFCNGSVRWASNAPDTFTYKPIEYEGNTNIVTTNTEQTITAAKLFSTGGSRVRISDSGMQIYSGTPSWALGLSYRDSITTSSVGNTVAGIGALGTSKGAITGLYMGIGNEPWNSGKGLFITDANITFRGNKVWHAGNDGSGSGLDADTVDGIHASSFALTTSKLANPYALTFTGAATGTYDGSAAKTVNIPAASTRASLGLNTTDAVVFAKVTASGGFWKESDKRLKSNIKPLRHTIEQITSIPTVEFDMNDKHQIGTIAQDIETVVPEVVSESDGIKKVEYSMMGILAIEGIKLLKQEIENLKKEIELLKNK